MATLYNVDSPITREQRNNLNATFQDILSRFNRIAYQISVLSGGQEVEDLLQSIQTAIDNANNAAQEVRLELYNKINEIDNILNNQIARVDDKLSQFEQKTDQVNQKLNEADQKIVELNVLQNDLISKLTDLNDFLNSLVHTGEYSTSIQYKKNNEVLYFGSTYRAKRDNIGVEPPQNIGESNDDWQLIARRGTDAATQNIRLWRGPVPPTDTTMLWFEDQDLATGQEILIFGGVAAPVDPLSLWLREGGI